MIISMMQGGQVTREFLGFPVPEIMDFSSHGMCSELDLNAKIFSMVLQYLATFTPDKCPSFISFVATYSSTICTMIRINGMEKI